MRKATCSKPGCDNPPVNPLTKRYCKEHHSEYMRNWRKIHPLNLEQRQKDSVRSIAGVYKRRGLLQPEPCKVCGTSEGVQMHHPNYNSPLLIEWMCRPCHLAHHRDSCNIATESTSRQGAASA